MPNLLWRVKLVAELRPGVTTETEGHYPAKFRSLFGDDVPVRV